MELADAGDRSAQTARQQQIERDDGDGEDNPDEAFAQHAQRAAGGDRIAEQGVVVRSARRSYDGAPCSLSAFSVSQKQYIARVSQRQSSASGRVMRVKRKMPGEESRISAA